MRVKRGDLDTNDNLLKGSRFSKDNQPIGEVKSDGKRKKSLLKDIASQLVSGASKDALLSLANYLGVEIDALDIETAMHIKQMEKALVEGDTRAYNAVMDRIKGRPIQAITIDEVAIKTRRYIDATGDN